MSDHILTKKNAETIEMRDKCEIYRVSKRTDNTIYVAVAFKVVQSLRRSISLSTLRRISIS